jgi:hypothetical protein
MEAIHDGHMNPLIVFFFVVLVVLLANTISRALLALQTWFLATITHKPMPPRPTNAEEAYELMKVMADRQDEIVAALMSLKPLDTQATEVIHLVKTSVHGAHATQEELLRGIALRQSQILDMLHTMTQDKG